jgi:hypothetical protein
VQRVWESVAGTLSSTESCILASFGILLLSWCKQICVLPAPSSPPDNPSFNLRSAPLAHSGASHAETHYLPMLAR